MAVKTDNRIDEILSHVEVGDKVADIGCDHGKIANLAVKITKCAAYATDISELSLSKAKQLADELNQQNMVICKVGDGLKPLEGCEVDTIIIAGMGGHEIIKILSEATKRYRKYILVPHQHAAELRSFLCVRGYKINRDYYIECESKFYPIIVADGTSNTPTALNAYQLLYGLEKTPSQEKYICKRLETLESLKEKATGNRLSEIQEEIDVTKNYVY